MLGLGNILITGGAGFVGANLVHYLRRHGLADHICVLDNETLGSRTALTGLDVDFHAIDIRNIREVAPLIEGIDAVIHLAADTRVIDSIENPRFNFDNNVTATFNILALMADKGVKTFINASTGGAILGDAPPPVNEQMAPAPLSPYGASKLAVEGYASAFSSSYGMTAVSLRFSNVYGPRSVHKGSVVAAFIRQILAGEPITVYGDGEQTRDYIYIEDLCAGIVAGLQTKQSGVYQLGTGVPTSINQLIGIMRNAIGDEHCIDVRYAPERLGEVQYTYCDITKAQRTLNFSPSMQLAEGFRRTWDWFQARQLSENETTLQGQHA